MHYSLNSLERGDVGDYTGPYYKGYFTRSSDYNSHGFADSDVATKRARTGTSS